MRSQGEMQGQMQDRLTVSKRLFKTPCTISQRKGIKEAVLELYNILYISTIKRIDGTKGQITLKIYNNKRRKEENLLYKW